MFEKVLRNMGVEAKARLGERLGAPEMFGEDAGTRTRGAEGLELRLAKRWNEQVSHYDGSETGAGIRNVQEWDS